MPSLNIRVGASVDRNLQVAFQPLVEGAKRAKTAIETETAKGARAISTNVKKGTKDAEARFRELENEVKTGMKRSMNAGSAAVVQFASETKKNLAQTKRSFAELAAEAEKSLKKIDAAEKKAAAGGGLARRLAGAAYTGAGGTEGVKAGFSRVGRAAYGVGRYAAGKAFQLAGSMARASGIDTDAGSIMKKNFDLDQAAQNLSNASIVAQDPLNRKRVSKEELASQALDVGEKTGSDANEALAGLAKFVSKTGDLKTGRDIMMQMAVYAKATGGSAEDMMDASGDLANQLGDGVDKAKTLSELMKAFAGQGRLGAIEIKHLSTQMAKIGAASSRFEGGTQSIVQMGAMAQLARASGGSPSTSSAATSVSAFGDMFSKKARLAAWEKFGVNTEGAGGKVKDPKTLILEALQAAEKHGGGLGKGFDKVMGTMIASSKARQTTLGMESAYKGAGGGEAGVAAAKAAFEKFEKAIIADEEIQASFNRAMKTSSSQAEVFNNAIRKSAMQMQQDLAPAMASLMAAAIPLAKKFAGMVQLATGDKTGAGMKTEAETQVGEAVANSKKQVEGGKISDAQLDQNKDAAKAALWSKQRAAAELKTAEETLKEKQGNPNLSFDPTTGFGLGGYLWDKTVGTDEKGAAADVETKKKNLADANATYEKMTATNEDIKRKLDGQLLVRITNVDELKSAVRPQLGDGRTPSPEEKASQ